MTCKYCGCNSQNEFWAEIAIHSPREKGLDKPAVLVFPKLAVCSECGFTDFTIPNYELRLLVETVPAAIGLDEGDRGNVATLPPAATAIHQDWRELCKTTLHEADQDKLASRIDEAERALTKRSRELYATPNAGSQEWRDVDRGLYGLRALRSCLTLRNKKVRAA